MNTLIITWLLIWATCVLIMLLWPLSDISYSLGTRAEVRTWLKKLLLAVFPIGTFWPISLPILLVYAMKKWYMELPE
jgi:hypothetical protein